MERLEFPAHDRAVVDRYLPESRQKPHGRPYVTLTYATSLDSNVAVNDTQSTALSGSYSKSMTHYLRIKHDAILVGSGTAISDNPTLKSRLRDVEGTGSALQPRPVILDRRARWNISEDSNIIRAARAQTGKGPWVFVDAENGTSIPDAVSSLVYSCGGDYLHASGFGQVLEILNGRGINSVMVEGGATLIKELLDNHLSSIDALIITIAPVYLGRNSVNITPSNRNSKANLPIITMQETQWLPLDNDVVMLGKPRAVPG